MNNKPKKIENASHIIIKDGYVFGFDNISNRYFLDAQYIMNPEQLREEIKKENPEIPLIEFSQEQKKEMAEEISRLIDAQILKEVFAMADNLNKTKLC